MISQFLKYNNCPQIKQLKQVDSKLTIRDKDSTTNSEEGKKKQ